MTAREAAAEAIEPVGHDAASDRARADRVIDAYLAALPHDTPELLRIWPHITRCSLCEIPLGTGDCSHSPLGADPILIPRRIWEDLVEFRNTHGTECDFAAWGVRCVLRSGHPGDHLPPADAFPALP